MSDPAPVSGEGWELDEWRPNEVPEAERTAWWPYRHPLKFRNKPDQPPESGDRLKALNEAAEGKASGHAGEVVPDPVAIQVRMDTWGLGDVYDPARSVP